MLVFSEGNYVSCSEVRYHLNEVWFDLTQIENNLLDVGYHFLQVASWRGYDWTKVHCFIVTVCGVR